MTWDWTQVSRTIRRTLNQWAGMALISEQPCDEHNMCAPIEPLRHEYYVTQAEYSCLEFRVFFLLPYYLPIVGERIFGFIPFLKVLASWEMQTALSRFWTQVTESNSFENNYHIISIPFFPQYISAVLIASTFVQDLNPVHRVYFLLG